MEQKIDVYQKLRMEIDKMPVAYPPTKSGVEIQLLKKLFTPEEAEIALHLSILPESLSRIHKRMVKSGKNISKEDLAKILDTMLQKGSILGGGLFERQKGKGKYYSKSILAIGMFEGQVNSITPGLSRDFHQYLEEGFFREFNGIPTPQMRTVPISRSLKPDSNVATYDDMRRYIMEYDDIMVVQNCICRQSMDVLDKHCSHSDVRETCLAFGDSARFIFGKGLGRKVDREEMLQILGRAEDAGFVLQPENSKKPTYMCCCCKDCCHVLYGLKLYPRPADHIHSNYFSVIDSNLCNGCRKCEKKCPMEAITVADKKAGVNLDRCIGCGICVGTCNTAAASLDKKKTIEKTPGSHDALYMTIMKNRFGTGKLLKIMGKYMLGKRV